jgi:hypothetical protein
MAAEDNLSFTAYKPPEPPPPDFCKCAAPGDFRTVYGDFGFYTSCGRCGKPLRKNYHYYDNTDAEETDIFIYTA